jgi:hypothetical protein
VLLVVVSAINLSVDGFSSFAGVEPLPVGKWRDDAALWAHAENREQYENQAGGDR